VKGIIGKKLGMTQVFNELGRAVPVTVIMAGPCIITEVRNKDKHGYTAIQLGFGTVKAKLVEKIKKKEDRKSKKVINKPIVGYFESKELKPMRHLRELRIENIDDYKIGQEIKVTIFNDGEFVDVVGQSKGKGFAGGMKRHNFKGGPRSHGSMIHRQPASSGSTDAARTIKGTKKPGRLGNDRISAQGLQIVRVDGEKNLLLIKGSVPGPPKGLLIIKESCKRKKAAKAAARAAAKAAEKPVKK